MLERENLEIAFCNYFIMLANQLNCGYKRIKDEIMLSSNNLYVLHELSAKLIQVGFIPVIGKYVDPFTQRPFYKLIIPISSEILANIKDTLGNQSMFRMS